MKGWKGVRGTGPSDPGVVLNIAIFPYFCWQLLYLLSQCLQVVFVFPLFLIHRHFSFSLFQKQRHSWQFSNSSCLRLYFCRTSHFPRGYAPYFLRQDLSDDANDACDAIFEISQPDN